MSRSKPDDRIQNPAQKFFSWDGSEGQIIYFDKDLPVDGKEKKGGNVPISGVFTFILLDELATIKGWHEASSSGIYSNEVKDTRQEVLVVRNFNKDTLAEGVYKAIKDRVVSVGGKYCASLYIAYKDDDGLKIGNLSLKGAGFGPWLEFAKKNRADIYKKAVYISGKTEGKKGKVKFQMPVFALKDITEETNDQATELDKQLQTFLASYLSRPKVQQASEHEDFNQSHDYGDQDAPPSTDPDFDDPDSIPF